MIERLTPEQRILAGSMPATTSRRRLLVGAGLGGALALLATNAQARGATGEKDWDKIGEADEDETPESFTGPLFGQTVTWDPDSWAYSVGSDPELGYDYDFIGLSGAVTSALCQVEHHDAPFATIVEAEDGAFEHYLSRYAMTPDDTELLEQWAGDDAIGILYYWLGYDDIPYTYVEYAPSAGDEDVWSITYIQVRASQFDEDSAPALFEGVWIDDEPVFRAAAIADVIDAIVSDMD